MRKPPSVAEGAGAAGFVRLSSGRSVEDVEAAACGSPPRPSSVGGGGTGSGGGVAIARAGSLARSASVGSSVADSPRGGIGIGGAASAYTKPTDSVAALLSHHPKGYHHQTHFFELPLQQQQQQQQQQQTQTVLVLHHGHGGHLSGAASAHRVVHLHARAGGARGAPTPGADSGYGGICPLGPTAAVSGVVYCLSSGALTLLNKSVLVSYGFGCVHALLLFHCCLAVMLVRAAAALRLARVEPLTWRIASLWLPVNVLFVGMLATNFYALKSVGVGMVSALKAGSQLFIIVGDWLLFRRCYTWHVWACLALVVASALCGGATDAQFSLTGYAWQLLNNVFAAGYALYLSGITAKLASLSSDAAATPGHHGSGAGGIGVQASAGHGAAGMSFFSSLTGAGKRSRAAGAPLPADKLVTSTSTSSGGSLPPPAPGKATSAAPSAMPGAGSLTAQLGRQLSMVYYNNLLSLPLVALLVVATGEHAALLSQPALQSRSFQAYATLGGLLGFLISLTSIWFVSLTSATLYSLAGSLNKVAVAAAGIWAFGEPTSPSNLASIAVGLLAGGLLPFIKSRHLPNMGSGSGISTVGNSSTQPASSTAKGLV